MDYNPAANTNYGVYLTSELKKKVLLLLLSSFLTLWTGDTALIRYSTAALGQVPLF